MGAFISASRFEGNQWMVGVIGIFLSHLLGKGSLYSCSYSFTASQLSISVRSNTSREGRWDSECSLGNSVDGVASTECELLSKL